MKKIVIAIDGFSSCGKSSFAKAIAQKYGFIFIDTGAMYRAISLYAMRCGFIKNGTIDRRALIESLPNINIYFKKNDDSVVASVMLNDEDVSSAIRSAEVSSCVSQISSVAEVRHKMVELQQEMGKARGVVMDGRDIGTVVFPDAELKIFMTASVDVRAERRYKELLGGVHEMSLEAVKENISSRDEIDVNRAEGPLRQAKDAIVLDNSDMTIDMQMDWVDSKLADMGILS